MTDDDTKGRNFADAEECAKFGAGWEKWRATWLKRLNM
jgi:hypothetical protein